MNRARQTSLAMLAAALIPSSAWAQGGIQYDKIEIKTDKLAPNLYMLSGSENVDPGHPDGAGGRIGVLAGKRVMQQSLFQPETRIRRPDTALAVLLGVIALLVALAALIVALVR